jgi:tRNA/rRNA methyltransferase
MRTACHSEVVFMPGAGTDKTQLSAAEGPAPVVVLVEPQLGENIGMTARAMGNFGLTELRLVKPRDGWPSLPAQRAAAGADHVINAVRLFDTVETAIADCTLVFATTARAHYQAKPVLSPEAAAKEMQTELAASGRAAILFGRERYGLENQEVALANRIVTFPVNPGFASLNLAQAVLLMGYEWFRCAGTGLPFDTNLRSERAGQQQLQAFFDGLIGELDRVEFLRPAEKRETMLVNLRNIFTRMEPTKQDLQTLNGIVSSLVAGRRGAAKGGVLENAEASRLRTLLAESGTGARPSEGGPMRGLARLLRRNPTDAERALWQALRTDRRFAGQFKRQTPVGKQIPDFVSFPLRFVIELVLAEEAAGVVADRAERRRWLEERNYRVFDIHAVDIETRLADVLNELERSLSAPAA